MLEKLLVRPTPAERSATLPGDDLVDPADVVMDRAFTLDGMPDEVWPWLVQLGKRRAGWYLPRWVERLIPSSRRGLRRQNAAYLCLGVGDVIPDWGGRDETFTVAELEPCHHLLHTSVRGRTHLTWCLHHTEVYGRTRLHLRLRLAPSSTGGGPSTAAGWSTWSRSAAWPPGSVSASGAGSPDVRGHHGDHPGERNPSDDTTNFFAEMGEYARLRIETVDLMPTGDPHDFTRRGRRARCPRERPGSAQLGVRACRFGRRTSEPRRRARRSLAGSSWDRVAGPTLLAQPQPVAARTCVRAGTAARRPRRGPPR